MKDIYIKAHLNKNAGSFLLICQKLFKLSLLSVFDEQLRVELGYFGLQSSNLGDLWILPGLLLTYLASLDVGMPGESGSCLAFTVCYLSGVLNSLVDVGCHGDGATRLSFPNPLGLVKDGLLSEGNELFILKCVTQLIKRVRVRTDIGTYVYEEATMVLWLIAFDSHSWKVGFVTIGLQKLNEMSSTKTFEMSSLSEFELSISQDLNYIRFD